MKTLICDCNRTMPLDRPALAKALSLTPGASAEGVDIPLSLLCRRQCPLRLRRKVSAYGSCASALAFSITA